MQCVPQNVYQQYRKIGAVDIGMEVLRNGENMRIIFATTNEGKMKEIRMIMADLGMEILSMKEAGCALDIVEDGTSFEENAVIKARAVADVCSGKKGTDDADYIVLADDSGLEVDYLNKEPGIYSARYLGEDTPYSVKNKSIIDRLDGVEDEKRTARFVCAIAAVFPDGAVRTTRGTIEGIITREPMGENGFGYDPIVYVTEFKKTTAQLTPEEKNKVSHRGKALEQMKKYIQEWM